MSQQDDQNTTRVPTIRIPPMFRPPINRAMRVLDRSFFRKIIPLSAATVFDNANIARVRTALAKTRDSLDLPRLEVVREVPSSFLPSSGGMDNKEVTEMVGGSVDANEEEGGKAIMIGEGKKGKKSSSKKCLLLREGIKFDGMLFFFGGFLYFL